MDRLMIIFVIGLTVVSAKRVNEMKIAKGFDWKNCNETAVPMSFTSLSLSPNPIQYGKNIVLSAGLSVTKDIGTQHSVIKADVQANMTVKGKQYDMCQYEPTACHIEDLCEKISKLKMPCPADIKKMGSNCRCPLKKRNYVAKNVEIKIPNTSVQIEGTFDVKIDVTESGKPVGCLYLEFCLGECT